MLKPDYPIRTPRLALRPFTADDLDALYEFHRLAEVTRYLYHEPRNRAQVSVLLAVRDSRHSPVPSVQSVRKL